MSSAEISSGQGARPLPAVEGGQRARLWEVLAIFLLTLLAYLPALRGGMLWDDDRHVTKLALRSWDGLRRIWCELGATQQYYPVAHSAFWLEHRLWGDATLGYHLLNVLLHATNAYLFMAILRRLGRGAMVAWVAGLIFALHPVCVESVAWISEQKNTLSTAFYLLAALTYLPLTGLASAAAGTRVLTSARYWLATLLFALALLTKSVTATLPAALLVVLWWRRGGLSWRRDAVPLLPWFALGAGVGLFTSRVERIYIIGAEKSEFALSLVQRCLVAGRAAWFYLGKLLWPADLVFIYPRWHPEAGALWQYVFPLAALAAMAGLVLGRRRGALAGALVFVGTLFPALGFFDVYPFLYSFVADHFQYLASLGVIAGVAAGVAGGRWRLVVAAGAIALLGVLTWRQCGGYRDAETLYRTILRRNPGSWMAHTNLGKLLRESGDNAGALAEYGAALRLKPDAKVHYDLGAALMVAGRLEEAKTHYETALHLRPAFAEAHSNLALVLAAQGHLAEAIQHDEAALRLKPEVEEVHNNLGNLLVSAHRLPEAVDQFAAAIHLQADYASPHNGLGAVYFRMERIPEAAMEFAAAVKLNPGYADARLNLAQALVRLGQRDAAIAQCQETLRLQPGMARARALLQKLTAGDGRSRLPEPKAGAASASDRTP